MRLDCALSSRAFFVLYFRTVLLHNALLHGMWLRFLPFSHLCPSILSLSGTNGRFCSPWHLRSAPPRWLRSAVARCYGYQRRLCPLPPVLTEQDGSPRSSGSAHSDPASSGVFWRRRHVSLCPIASLEDFLDFRCSLGILHNFFFSPFSTSVFSELLR